MAVLSTGYRPLASCPAQRAGAQRLCAIGTDRLCSPVGKHVRCWRSTGRAARVPVLPSLTQSRPRPWPFRLRRAPKRVAGSGPRSNSSARGLLRSARFSICFWDRISRDLGRLGRLTGATILSRADTLRTCKPQSVLRKPNGDRIFLSDETLDVGPDMARSRRRWPADRKSADDLETVCGIPPRVH